MTKTKTVARAQRSFHTQSYSENSSLKVFLRTLSYHKIGADIMAKTIMAQGTGRKWRLVDVGCGDGQFTAELLTVLKRAHSLPERVMGVDPDSENLRDYQGRLDGFPVSVSTRNTGVESLKLKGWDVMIASHSLYHLLENPINSEAARLRILKRLVPTKTTGHLTIISHASAGSPAYRLKRLVLGLAGLPDRSSFGEYLDYLFARIGARPRFVLAESYMDVSELFEDKASLSAWMQYFCRLSASEFEQIGLRNVRKILERVSVKFGSLPLRCRNEFRGSPALLGVPNSSSMILPHLECFLVLSR